MLSDQIKLELLADGIVVSQSRDEHGEFQDIHVWDGVVFDAVDEISTIDWSYESTRTAPMPMNLLPHTLRAVRLSGMNLTGTLSTAHLPQRLLRFNIANNSFYGQFYTGALPAVIEHVHIFSNRFSDRLNIATLPASLEVFNARDNRFSGTLDFSNLPESLRELWLGENRFTGNINISKLPESLELLVLSDNALKQDTVIVDSSRLHFVHEGGNKFGDVVHSGGNSIES